MSTYIIWTCLAFVTRSTSGKSKKADANKLSPITYVSALKKESGWKKETPEATSSKVTAFSLKEKRKKNIF